MDIDVFQPGELPTVTRVLRTAIAPDRPLDERGRRFIAAYARIAGFEAAFVEPERIDADDVRIDGARQRKRLLQLAAIAALLPLPLRMESVVFLQKLRRALSVDDPVVDVLAALDAGRFLRVRLMTMGRMLRVMLAAARAAEDWRGIARLLGAMLLRLPVNREQRHRFRRLGLLPEGTLGREYWKHMTRQGFEFPGERGGIPASVAYHDLGHVLAGHPATGRGEIQQGAFQGGNRREDGFVFVQFALLHFHHGVRIAPGAPPETGHFEPERVLWALHRGARCSVDMTQRWNFWPLMALPLGEARARCGLLPGWSEQAF
jgi:hypothetical protein